MEASSTQTSWGWTQLVDDQRLCEIDFSGFYVQMAFRKPLTMMILSMSLVITRKQ